MATTHYSTQTFIDATGETSTMKVYNDAITAVSLPGFLTDFGDFKTKTAAITRGEITRTTWVGDADETGNTAPSDQLAQRENKLLVTYRDTTTNEKYTLTVPTIDLTLLTFIPGGKDAVAIPTAGPLFDWITSFETLASPPEAPGNAVEVIALRFVGRNT